MVHLNFMFHNFDKAITIIYLSLVFRANYYRLSASRARVCGLAISERKITIATFTCYDTIYLEYY